MIKVSVFVITYNQEKYIGHCLESLVTQETDFDFEIYVGDDFSTDGTSDVIQEYQKNYEDI
ncbi:glycosyltransferase, partial [Francisella tularensis subsp. holarctica]|uniref:glycosyltransferase family 2 protein n=1 Tax=Francisella tularensis TaxID=263 RepID=UPI002381BB04